MEAVSLGKVKVLLGKQNLIMSVYISIATQQRRGSCSKHQPKNRPKFACEAHSTAPRNCQGFSNRLLNLNAKVQENHSPQPLVWKEPTEPCHGTCPLFLPLQSWKPGVVLAAGFNTTSAWRTPALLGCGSLPFPSGSGAPGVVFTPGLQDSNGPAATGSLVLNGLKQFWHFEPLKPGISAFVASALRTPCTAAHSLQASNLQLDAYRNTQQTCFCGTPFQSVRASSLPATRQHFLLPRQKRAGSGVLVEPMLMCESTRSGPALGSPTPSSSQAASVTVATGQSQGSRPLLIFHTDSASYSFSTSDLSV